MKPAVICVGDVNIDIITDPLAIDQAKNLIMQKEAEIISNFTLSLGGNAANCATALSKLGIKSRLIGALSNDPISNWIKGYLDENGVDFQNCPKETPSGITFAVTYDDGSRTFISSFGSNQLLSYEDIDLRLIEGRHLHRAGYWWAPKFMGQGTARLFQVAKKNKLSTSLDIGWDPKGWTKARRNGLFQCLSLCDIFFLNVQELEALTNTNLEHGIRIILQAGVKMIGLHCGDSGCKIITTDQIIHVPSYKVPLNNPAGTGDIFNAAFIYGYLQNWDLEQIGKFSNATASLHLSDRMKIYPSLQEVQKFQQEAKK
ncbi:MAG: carbohydrate kinase family protein [Candidatus Helarchaeota archaeon]